MDQRHWDDFYSYQERPFWQLPDHVLTAVFELAKVKSPEVLDAGCGTGDFSNRLKQYWQCDVVGMDLSTVAVQTASRRYPDIHFMQGDLQHLPSMDKNYDVVFLNLVLAFVPSPEQVLKTMQTISHNVVIASPVASKPAAKKDTSRNKMMHRDTLVRMMRSIFVEQIPLLKQMDEEQDTIEVYLVR